MARGDGEGRLRARAHPHRPGAADERRRPRRAAHRDPGARRAAVGDRRPARARTRRCRPTSPRSGAPSRPDRPALETVVGELRGGTDYANLPARRALGSRLPQAAERARPDAARVVCRAALGRSRRWLGARYPAGRAAACLEDAAAEPSARQHLRLQHRRRARGEHDARSRARARSATRWSTPRSTRSPTRCRAPPPRHRSVRSSSTPTPSRARRSSRRSSICPIDSAEPWRQVDAQALDRPVAFWPREATITDVTGPDGQPSSFRSLAKNRSSAT